MKVKFEVEELEGIKAQIKQDVLAEVKGEVRECVNDNIRKMVMEKLDQMEQEPYAIVYRRIENLIGKAMKEVAADIMDEM